MSSPIRFDDPVIPGTTPPPTNALVAIVEQHVDEGSDDRIKVGLVCVVPGTGDITWDEFEGECRDSHEAGPHLSVL